MRLNTHIRTLTNKFILSGIIIIFLSTNLEALNVSSEFKITRPANILKDGQESSLEKGVEVRKGTLKSTIDNILNINALYTKYPEYSQKHAKQIEEFMIPIQELVLALHAVDFFTFFKPSEWLSDETNYGRILTTIMYLKTHLNTLESEEKNKVLAQLNKLK